MRVTKRWRVGIDTGGTFTDLVALGPDGAVAVKVPSTPDDPSRAVAEALAELRRLRPELVDLSLPIVHGSTVATNALLEGTGARVVLVTSAGFEDLIEIGRQARRDLYALGPGRPDPLVERRDRIALAERTLADGRRLRRPSPEELRTLSRRVARRRPDAVAIGLLHSYANPAAEREAERALRSLGVPLTRSSAVAPLFREYERFSTTVANAALLPVMRRYLGGLQRRLRGDRLLVMQSSGGLTSAARAARRPVQMVLSGPAGGIGCAEYWLGRLRDREAVSFDMGGTSTDVGLISGRAGRTEQIVVAGRPLVVEAVEMLTIGAGGGSLLWQDAGGSLRVGPRSAGADPGPACYGRGSDPCLTDAHVLLGRLPAGLELGGRIRLDAGRSERALRSLAQALRATPRETAAAALRIADAAMERAIQAITLQRGHDPRRLALLAFGGAGGLHACRLARRLDMPEVLIPPHPGAVSAHGMAVCDARLDLAEGWIRTLEGGTLQELSRRLQDLGGRARELLRRELGPGRCRVERRASCRYLGQSFELAVAPGPGLRARFEALHEQRYGFRQVGRPLQCVGLHATAVRPFDRPRDRPTGSPTRRKAPVRERVPVRLEGAGTLRVQRVPLLQREELLPGMELAGPALVVEATATTIIEPDFTLRVDPTGCLRLRPR